MKLFAAVIICAAVLYWADSAFFNGTYFNAFDTVVSQTVAHY